MHRGASSLQRRHKTPKRLARGTPRLGENNGASGAPAFVAFYGHPYDEKGRPQERLVDQKQDREQDEGQTRGGMQLNFPRQGLSFRDHAACS